MMTPPIRSATIRSAVVAAMIGAATLASMGIAGAASLHDQEEQLVLDYLTKVVGDFDADAVAVGPLDDRTPQQQLEAITARYMSGSPEDGTQTVVVKIHHNAGGARPSTWYKAFSYHNAARAPITFDALFRPGTAPLEAIAPIVAREMSARAGQPIEIDPAVGNDPANYRNFAITSAALVFFFDQSQMHPAYGATEVAVPRAALAGLLRPVL
jgi:hypothetical protein